tara:strand:+ start:377 stop:616 length:240 start_codon:yes stop_codon:yes gene_type:complete
MTLDRKKEILKLLKAENVDRKVIGKVKEILTRPADSSTGEKYISMTVSGSYRLRIGGEQYYLGSSLKSAISKRNELLSI